MAGLFKEGTDMDALTKTLPQIGRVVWIGVRPGRRERMEVKKMVMAKPGSGLDGDRFAGNAESKRQVTLIQAEHLAGVGSMLGNNGSIDPGLVRRNIVVEGINLLALKGGRFSIGGALMEMTGLCHPYSRMEEVLGAGGYNAMRGHGGITARVLEEGIVRIDDEVAYVVSENNARD